MNISTGDIYWIQLESNIPHPHVVIQLPNIESNEPAEFLVSLITTNKKKTNMPGNVALDKNEGNLSKPSIVDVANTIKVQESDLGEYIGKLSEKRVKEISSGIEFLERTYFRDRN